MLSTRIAAAVVTIATLATGISATRADDQFGSRKHSHGHSRQDKSFYGENGLPSYIHGIGTYAGGIAGIRDRHNGIYFAVERWRDANPSVTSNAVRPRIIHVNKKTAGAQCSYEVGVCVIRP